MRAPAVTRPTEASGGGGGGGADDWQGGEKEIGVYVEFTKTRRSGGANDEERVVEE